MLADGNTALHAHSGSSSSAEGAGLPEAIDGIAREIMAATRPATPAKDAAEARSPEAGLEESAAGADSRGEDGSEPSAVSRASSYVVSIQHAVCRVQGVSTIRSHSPLTTRHMAVIPSVLLWAPVH